jgi:PAS domain S-box-containing protein
LEDYQKELTYIKELLRANPRGMTVTDISREIGINRNSVAKYLDVLLISGQVEMKRMGPAKAYFLSHRIPMSAMLNFSSDCILVFNSQLKVVQVNDIFLDLINADRDDVIDCKLSTVPFPIINDPDVMTGVLKGLEGNDSSIEKSYLVEGSDLYLNIKFIPSTFQDGSLGVNLLMENITERVRVEEELRESEETLSSFMDSATDGFSLFDSKLNLININKAATSRFGVSREDILGKNILELRPNSKDTGLYDKYLGVMRTGEPCFDEFDIVHHELGIRHLTLKAFKVEEGLGVITTDITERKQAEKTLKKAQELLDNFLTSAVDGFIILDSDLIILEMNETAIEQLGKTREQVIGLNLEDISPDLKKSGRYEQYMKVMETGQPLIIEDFATHPKFGDIYVSIKAFKMDQGLGLIASNITEQKRMEIALRESEERFSTICSNISDIVWTIDLERNVTMISPSVASILGYSVEEAMNTKLEDLLTPPSYELAVRTLAEELEKEKTGGADPDRSRTLELELNHKDGSTVMTEVRVTFLRDQEGKPVEVLGVARDVTERLRYRDKLEALHIHAINLALTPNIDEIAKTTLDAIELIFKIEDLEFIIAKDQTLRLVTRKGPGAPKRTMVPFDGQGVIAKAARTKSSILVNDVRKDPDYFEARSRTLSELAVPVKINDDLHAILNLESPNEGAFTLEDQKLLETFAGHVASAMKRIESP